MILQEIGQALDTPDDIVFDWLQEAAYPGPAARPDDPRLRRAGGRLRRGDLRRFVAEHYGPGQMILCAAGAVDHDAICRAAEALFGAPRATAPVAAIQPARLQGGERREIKALEQVHFALALEAPSYRDPTSTPAQVWATALGGGMSSRLFQEIRENRGLCYTIFAQAGAYEDTGLIDDLRRHRRGHRRARGPHRRRAARAPPTT